MTTPDLKAVALAATTLDIERERPVFEAAYIKNWPEACGLNPLKFFRDEDGFYEVFSVQVAFDMWCICKRSVAERLQVAEDAAKDARLKHLYDKQMAQLVKPCMSFDEWLNAIDVFISGDIAARRLTP